MEVVEEGRGPKVQESQGLWVQRSKGPEDQDISNSNSNTSLTLKKVHLVLILIRKKFKKDGCLFQMLPWCCRVNWECMKQLISLAALILYLWSSECPYWTRRSVHLYNPNSYSYGISMYVHFSFLLMTSDAFSITFSILYPCRKLSSS